MECAVGNREIGFWQCKKAEIVLISFLTSGFAVFISLWLLVLPNSNNLINQVLYCLYVRTQYSAVKVNIFEIGSLEVYDKGLHCIASLCMYMYMYISHVNVL